MTAAARPETERYDAVVVGAGPAGSSAAYHLARRGRRVLVIDRAAFPRDKSCGDGLTRPAVEALAEMGVLEELREAQRVRGVRVCVDGHGSRDFEYPREVTGLVVPRQLLDATLCRRAVAVGAELRERTQVSELLVEDGTAVGVRVGSDSSQSKILAPVVVVANGSGSRLLERAGLVPRSEVGLGVAIRGYYEGIAELEDLLEIHAPLTDPTGRELLPSYGWVFPTGPGSANVGVGVFEREARTNVRDLFERLVARFAADGGRLSEARLRGSWRGAPLRFDFAPGRCAGPGFVAVGDAAGMVSPFTGEGISYALESGRLAAEVIDRNSREEESSCPGLEDYSLLLEDRYTGYFETGRRSARRYRLAWRVLEATFDNERPLFQVLRRAALFPEGVGELYASRVLDDVSELVPRAGLRVREDLLAVGEVLGEAVRRDWPFLGRLAGLGRDDPGIPFRPALLLLLAAYFGDPRASGLVQVGAAVELGYLAALAQVSVEDEVSPAAGNGARPPDWGNRLAVMVGDFLLARGNELAAASRPEVVETIAAAMERACEGQARELSADEAPALEAEERIEIVERKTATLFELPCRLGAAVGGAPDADLAALCEYGRQLGIAYQLAEEGWAARGVVGPLVRAFDRDRGEGVVAADPDGAHAFELAVRHAGRAQVAVRELPEGPAKVALRRLATYAVTRGGEVPSGHRRGA